MTMTSPDLRSHISRRALFRERLLPAAFGASALAAGLVPAGARTLTPPRLYVSLLDFGITGRNDEDVSKAFQQAIGEAHQDGGGMVMCPPGLIWAKGLVVPNNITIQGAGVGATTVKLPDGANEDVILQSGYAENKTFANLYFGLRDLSIDGNKAKNKAGNLVVLRGWRGHLNRVRLSHAPQHGVLYSEKSLDGTLNLNGLAENSLRGCFISECNGAGLFADNEQGNRIADMFVVDCVFHFNGTAGYYQIDLERAAGFHIKGNQMYNGHLGDIRALGAGALIVALNHFDGTGNNPVDGVLRQVVVETGGWGNVVIANNLFHTHRRTDPAVTDWRQLEIASHAKSGVSITGNSFYASFDYGVSGLVRRGPGADSIAVSGNAFGGTSREVTIATWAR